MSKTRLAKSFDKIFASSRKINSKLRRALQTISCQRTTPYVRCLRLQSLVSSQLVSIDTEGTVRDVNSKIIAVPKTVVLEDTLKENLDTVRMLMHLGVTAAVLQAVGIPRAAMERTGLIEAPVVSSPPRPALIPVEEIPERKQPRIPSIDSGRGPRQRGVHPAELLPDGTYFHAKSLTISRIQDAMKEIERTPRYIIQQKYGTNVQSLLNHAKRLKEHGVDIEVPIPYGRRSIMKTEMPDGSVFSSWKYTPNQLIDLYVQCISMSNEETWEKLYTAKSEILRKTARLLHAGMKLPDGIPIHPMTERDLHLLKTRFSKRV